ncbi:ribonucleoside-diphosphate reductase subunit alpha [Gephyromycinifex aptenodytis]|uniref:ribonucleoside-diphosphate reductase subunit alpha n=1 Tax=Gephyromycinifex aptenodytis TaxID=2716227 RepID=UPI0014455D3D|nr:ribonucleoside-diphosphate reductase subunit alpha [Gephyromycinifex aptenodytis]
MTMTTSPPADPFDATSDDHDGSRAPTGLRVTRRDGTVSEFDQSRIAVAISKAFLAVEGDSAAASSRLHRVVEELTTAVTTSLRRQAPVGMPVHIEHIQDQVELALMRAGHHQVARAYVLYREEHARARSARQPEQSQPQESGTRLPAVGVVLADGTSVPADWQRARVLLEQSTAGIADVAGEPVLAEMARTVYDGMSEAEFASCLVLGARTLVEKEPNYSRVAARLLLDRMRTEALSHLAKEPQHADAEQMRDIYPRYFREYLHRAVQIGRVDPELLNFDLDRIAAALIGDRDLEFNLLGLQTVYDRYVLHENGTRFELPQAFFMRVAMGLALREDDREERAIEFYRLLSDFDVMTSTPTLFNAGTTRPQLSSCFLTTVADDLDSIFGSYRNNALLAKYSGGLGNDWSPVRGLGAHIHGTNGQSQGVVPFLKIANDTTVAVNQGGKRKGAACAYLETWHIDIEEFLDLRKNAGDDRRRTHDMNTANWIPDEFMRRVENGGQWTLFSPDETPDLHDLVGAEFSARYAEYEAAADQGQIRVWRRVEATTLWRRMLTMLFETGHPWITFKDPCNLRSPQQHVGVVHSSNLCTEITLNTSVDEVAVCNLASINLARHVSAQGGLDTEKLRRSVRTAVRMLDDVIDINHYTIPATRRSNLRHRPVGLGLMGYQDALFVLGLPFASKEAVEFADTSMEAISYYAIEASADLAAERGAYPSFEGSLWSRGILPIDSLALLKEARGEGELEVDTSSTLDWGRLRDHVRALGMRNSNVMAIAPTATISNICGVSASIEPQFQNLFVKSNMSGDFTVVNAHLVAALKERGLWDEVMVADLKYFDGSLNEIDRVPQDVRDLFATAFEIEPRWLVAAAARRQKWIDQAQSLNLYVAAPSGRALDELYRHAWKAGLKTTYYLRARAATQVEKSTLAGTDGRLNAVAPGAPSAPLQAAPPAQVPAACSITDPDCEACQ